MLLSSSQAVALVDTKEHGCQPYGHHMETTLGLHVNVSASFGCGLSPSTGNGEDRNTRLRFEMFQTRGLEAVRRQRIEGSRTRHLDLLMMGIQKLIPLALHMPSSIDDESDSCDTGGSHFF